MQNVRIDAELCILSITPQGVSYIKLYMKNEKKI